MIWGLNTMTENKRFRIINDCGDYHLLDGDNKLGYDLCSPSMYKENYKNIVECLNALHEEKEQLKSELEYYKAMVHTQSER